MAGFFRIVLGLAIGLVLLPGMAWFGSGTESGSGAGGAMGTGAPRVVASIKPVHAVAAALLRDIAKPGLIVEGAHSHHGFRLKPSKARLLSRAKLVLWLGASGEPGLAKAIKTLQSRTKAIAVADLPGLKRLPRRANVAHIALPNSDAHNHHDDEHAHEPKAHEAKPQNDAGWDSHIWLDPGNAVVMAEAVAPQLMQLYPGQRAQIAANLASFKTDVAKLDQQIAKQLQPVRAAPFAVLHDAYQYFEKHYGLNDVSALLRLPGQPGSVRRIKQFKDILRRSKTVCMFVEPQFSDRLARAVVTGTQTRIAVLDPLGATLPPGPDLLFQLWQKLATDLRSCLAASPPKPDRKSKS